jgi:bifunctional DNA-binding transcriptional regulator/antitoxin component of YhaV-PrlF toxin-antitoxin module
MPLPHKIAFKTAIQQGNRVQIPKFVRLQYKIEANQVLKVGICRLNLVCRWQFFYAKIGKDGRIFIPKLTQALLQREKPNLAGYIFEITLEPA